VNIATEQIGDQLSASCKKASTQAENGKTVNWRTNPQYHHTPDNPRFTPGSVNFSPGWFAQGHEVGEILSSQLSRFLIQDSKPLQTLSDPIIPSTSLREITSLPWLICTAPITVLINAITALTNKELFLAAYYAMVRLKRGKCHYLKGMDHPHVQSWSSVFSGIAVISNRLTVRHRDKGGTDPTYDLLLSAGTHRQAYLHLDDIQAELSYSPGTVVLTCGRLLSHSLPEWSGGERICLAHFMRTEVLHRLAVHTTGWSYRGFYTRIMNRQFVTDQKWNLKQIYADGGDESDTN
jgi:hypothetical protein